MLINCFDYINIASAGAASGMGFVYLLLWLNKHQTTNILS